MYKAASFFSGIGGLDLAFAWAGFDIRLHVEIDDYCRKVLHKNRAYWPNARQLKDIRHVKKTEVGHVDVMFGGFPCQDISIAGKRAGIAKGNRSGLWFEFLRLIRQVRPAVVVLENVSAIHVPTRDEHGNEQQAPGLIVAATLSEVGYDAVWIPVRASDIGAPHQRERWFCVAYRKSQSSHDGKHHPRKCMARGAIQKPRNGSGTASLAYSDSNGRDGGRNHRQKRYLQRNQKRNISALQPERQGLKPKSRPMGSDGELGNTVSNGLQGRTQSGNTHRGRQWRKQRASRPDYGNGKQLRPQSRLGRVAHGLSRRLDRHQGQWPARPNSEQYAYEPGRVTDRKDSRIARIRALGNAVVPQQAYPIACAVMNFLKQTAKAA